MSKSKIWNISILLFCLVLSGIVSILLGQDNNWDLANYHIYGVDAFLKGKIGYDITPCGIQSYHNPFIDFPYYYMSQFLNNYPKVVAFIQGQYYGLLIFLIYKISTFIFKKTRLEKIFLVLFSCLISTTCFIVCVEIGTTFNDIQIGILVLASIYILLKFLFEEGSKKRSVMFFLAGLSLGIATGFKLTAVIYSISALLSVCCFYKKIQYPFTSLLCISTGILLGFGIVDGYWMYIIYKHFKNPVFPYYNAVFKSKFAIFDNYIDKRYFPNNIMQWIFFPFYWHRNDLSHIFEFQYRDFRFPLMYLSAILITIFELIFKKGKMSFNMEVEKYISKNNVHFILLFIVISYVFWLKQFSYLRYFLPIAALSGIIITILLVYIRIITKSVKIYLSAGSIILVFLLTTTMYSSGFRKGFNEKLFEVEDLKLKDNSVAIILGGYPIDIIAPFQNQTTRYINLYGDLHFPIIQPDSEKIRIKKIINENKKNIYLIFSYSTVAPLNMKVINNYINLKEFSCRPIKNNIGQQYMFCK